MKTCSTASLAGQRLLPLAAGVTALFGLGTHSALAATTHYVTSCNDAGSGSLRAVIADAGTISGDTVDFSGLSCSAISLSTGAIVVPQNDLSIVGSKAVPIYGKYNHDRLFQHAGSGTLSFLDVDMGVTEADGAGGCVFSTGTVALYNTRLSGCRINSASGYAYGGAVAAIVGVRLKYSQITDSEANSQTSGAYGGAVFTTGEFSSRYSTIANNKATGSGSAGIGGGVFATGKVSLNHVTISSNTAGYTGGGIIQDGGAPSFEMFSSTISGNEAKFAVGGVAVLGTPTVVIANSTIAFNRASTSIYAAGLALSTRQGGEQIDVTVKMQSTLISNNSAGSDDVDFSGFAYAPKQIIWDQASQANLIRAPGAGTLPNGTILVSCPRLGPLRDNGGMTQTHSLDSGTIAIDHGANPSNESQDQRGIGADSSLYPRVSNGKADIGAYEVNQSDVIFTSNLEGCRPVALP